MTLRRNLRVDALKTLVRRTRPQRGLLDPANTWNIDALAPAIPWRAALSGDDPILFARMAVLRAADAAAGALGNARGLREAKLRIRHGDDILGGRLPDLLMNLPPDQDPRRLLIELAAAETVRILGAADASPNALEAAAEGRAGDRADIEATHFVRDLATWWTRNTGRKPERRRKIGERADLRRAGRKTSFVAFVIAAWADAGGGVLSERTVRRALEA